MNRMKKCIAATSLVICISVLGLSGSASGAESAATRATRSNHAQHAMGWPTGAKFGRFIVGVVRNPKVKKFFKGLKHTETASDAADVLWTACDDGLLPAWFCRWMTGTVNHGVGITVASTPVWGPTGAVAYNLGPSLLVQLECWSTGPAQVWDGWSSRLYYRLPDGGWVNARWILTGTDSVQQGVRHC
jgi:hypothetical protein